MSDPYYPFYPGDYQRDTRGLTLIEHGAYRVLLDEYYTSGPLPSDMDRIYRIAGAISDEEKQAVGFVLNKFFSNENGNFKNERADREIMKRDAFLISQARKSALGVAARRKPTGKPTGKPQGQPLPSPSPSPSPYSSPAPGEQGTLGQMFEDFWTSYPKKKKKGDAEKAWKKIKPSKELFERILSKVHEGTRSFDWMKDGGKFIPYPASWLNAKGWEDEFKSPGKTVSDKTLKNMFTLQEWEAENEK